MCEEVNRVVAIILYPLSSQSDQHRFSPNKINISSRETVGRILKKVTKGKILSTNLLRKCVKISLENVYVDIEAKRVKAMSKTRISYQFKTRELKNIEELVKQ